MTSDILWIAAAAGLATFLMRLLPILVNRRFMTFKVRHPRLDRTVAGLGPAAVIAFLTLTLVPYFTADTAAQAAAAALAILAIAATRRIATGIALPTLIGASVYGVAVTYLPM